MALSLLNVVTFYAHVCAFLRKMRRDGEKLR